MTFFRYCHSADACEGQISGDLIALNMLGRSLLGREVNPATLLHLLWRLLCAPMMAWPFWTSKRPLSCQFSCVAAELGADCNDEHQSRPSFLRAGGLFEMVASHFSVQEDEITPQGVRMLRLTKVSSSHFDQRDILNSISSCLGAPPFVSKLDCRCHGSEPEASDTSRSSVEAP